MKNAESGDRDADLALLLRPLMSQIIDETQSAFVPGRLITDNIILGFEKIHWIRTRKTGKQGYVALKLDMSKAYDRVEWSFFEAVMYQMGFCELWIEKVMKCVKSVQYSFSLNFQLVGDLKPRRGIRQGDPLPPYLFTLCAEAAVEDCSTIVECLNAYASASGQDILIKSVLQAIPTYAMSCFRIPKVTCTTIEKECTYFWWGMESGNKRMHWKTWDFLCEPKCNGGLGFRKLEIFNKVLMVKQLWRIIQNTFSLVARVLKARTFKHVEVMVSPLGCNPSFIWPSLIWSRSLLEQGLCWRIGGGKSINLFRERWIPSRPCKFKPCEIQLPEDTEVYQRNMLNVYVHMTYEYEKQ
ncbi:uncharacterized protein [Henckelia pumila]|uniref:uncharacterized protein n=1 Tax=Henckelia pumila TaxID=405737 RepID=UPI003C6DFCA8